MKGSPTSILSFKATQVAAGDGFSCAITPGKTVACWGDNDYGELGDGNTNDASTPQPVTGLKNVVQIATGYFHACALLATGKIKCWGDNSDGQLGIGNTTTSDVPVGTEFGTAAKIAAGDDDTCAIDRDRRAQLLGQQSGRRASVTERLTMRPCRPLSADSGRGSAR